MNKRKLHHTYKTIKPISYWYFLVAFLVCLLVFVFAYRQNNLRMIELRQAVFIADEQDGDIETALNDLREHVLTHMNTDLSTATSVKPPIQLKNEYERLTQAEENRVARVNDGVYDKAQAICEERFPAGQLRSGRVQCVSEYVSNNSVEPNEVSPSLYQFDFVSPRWSPDLAGWSLVFSVIFGTLFLVRFIAEKYISYQLKQHA